MDFILELPRIKKIKIGFESQWIHSQNQHIQSMLRRPTIKTNMINCIWQKLRHYRVPVSIVSDWDSKFKSIFWESLHRAMNAQLRFSIFSHTQTDSLSKRVNQILEDLLRACAIDLQGSWVEFQLLVEFWYNKSYQVTIQMEPYEALYERKCRSSIHWDEVGDYLDEILYNKQQRLCY